MMRDADPFGRPTAPATIMRRMTRRIRMALRIASGVLTATALALCVIGLLREERLYVPGRTAQWYFESNAGYLSITRYDRWPDQPRWSVQTASYDLHNVKTPTINHRAGTIWQSGPFLRADGIAAVLLDSTGSANWNATIDLLKYPWSSAKYSRAMPYQSVRIAWWLLISLLASPLLIDFVRRMRRRWITRSRRRRGLCAACGYDLRASPEQCPECGNAVESAPPRAAKIVAGS